MRTRRGAITSASNEAFLVFIALIALHTPLASPYVQAQAPPPNASAPPEKSKNGRVVSSHVSNITAESVQERIKQLDEAGSLDEKTKKEAQDLYKRALEHLRSVQQSRQRLSDYVNATRDAPALLEEVRAQAEEFRELPADWNESNLDRLLEILADSEKDHDEAIKRVAQLESEAKNRTARQREIPPLLSAANQRLEQVRSLLNAPPANNEPAELSAARKTENKTRERAIESEIVAIKEELRGYSATSNLLRAEQDLAARNAGKIKERLELVRVAVQERRQQEAEAASREAAKIAEDAATSDPLVSKLAEENKSLAALRTGSRGIPARITQVTREHKAVTRALADVREQYKTASEKVEEIGVTNSLGMVLRNQRARLPSLSKHQRNLRERQAALQIAQQQLFEYESQRSKLADIKSHAQDLLATASVEEEQRTLLEENIAQLLEARRELLDDLLTDYRAYFPKLVELDADERQLIAEATKYDQFIAKHILWIRSTSPFDRNELLQLGPTLGWILDRSRWQTALGDVRQGMSRNPQTAFFWCLGFVGMWWARIRVWRRIRQVGENVCKRYTETSLATVEVLLLTIVGALFWPAVFAGLGWTLTGAPSAGAFTKALGAGFEAVAFLVLVLEFLRHVCRRQGLAQAHFRWPAPNLVRFRRQLWWLMVGLAPLMFVVGMTEFHDDDISNGSLGRLSFMASQCMLAVFVFRALDPRQGIMADVIHANPGGLLGRLKYVWYPIGILAPATLAVVAARGYYFTAIQFQQKIKESVLLVIGLVLVNALFLRWLLAARGKLAARRVRERRAEKHDAQAAPAAAASTSPMVEEPLVCLTTIGQHTGQLLRGAMSLVLLLGLWCIWVDLLPALRILDNVVLWHSTVTVTEAAPTETEAAANNTSLRSVEKLEPITLTRFTLALLIIAMTMAAARNLPGILEIALLQHLPMDAGGRYAILTLARYGIASIGLSFASLTIGIGWSKVQWLVAAMTVGLGFGLQEIFANFISGLILLFERPMRLGDVVTVGDLTGKVTRIRIRATTIVDWDHKELIVPNKEFITSKFVNWTLSDRLLRIQVPVGVAYGSDTELACGLMLRVAFENPDIVEDPAPRATFEGFGDSTLNLMLRVFVHNLDNFLEVRHQLHTAINRAFLDANIEIAFPQRELHFRTVSPGVASFSEQYLQNALLGNNEQKELNTVSLRKGT